MFHAISHAISHIGRPTEENLGVAATGPARGKAHVHAASFNRMLNDSSCLTVGVTTSRPVGVEGHR
jgi:hypothetical protein